MTDTSAVTFDYVAGDDITLEFSVTKDGEGISIAGMTPRFAIARRAGDAAVVSTEDSSAAATVTDGANGVFRVVVDAESTTALRGTYLFEAELEDQLGDKFTVSRGYVTFKAPVLQ